MPNVRLTIEYDGRLYHGWQRQKNERTIQGMIESALQQITGEQTIVVGAGRTDAGVHALGQVAHFFTRKDLDGRAWMMALNQHLPQDIVIRHAVFVPDSFHARYHARSKVYRYQILNQGHRLALGHAYHWVVHPTLKLSPMKRAAQYLMGTHDFSAFYSGRAQDPSRSPVCTIRTLELTRRRNNIVIEFEANRFLKQMVRSIVGTLVEVGRGFRTPSEVREILQSRDRRRAGVTAPPQGLFLVVVKY